MRVIEALRYIQTEYVMFGDMDQKDCNKVFTKPMKTKNITWETLRKIEWKWVNGISFNKGNEAILIRYSTKPPIYERTGESS